MRKLIALFTLIALVAVAWAQTNPLQDKVTTNMIYRLNAVGTDSVLNIATASTASDTFHWFRPAKWTTIAFAANGTFNTGSVLAEMYCGTKIGPDVDDFLLAQCDTLRVTEVSHVVWSLNLPACDVVLPVFSSAPTVTSVTIDSARVIFNW